MGTNDTTRRDALARSLCARLCDERRSADVLDALDKVLAHFEAEDVQPASLLYLLQHDRYSEDEGGEIEIAKRRSWNAAMQHATSLVRAFQGMDELRRQSQWPDERLDVGGEQ
jgi:hypothetical protein